MIFSKDDHCPRSRYLSGANSQCALEMILGTMAEIFHSFKLAMSQEQGEHQDVSQTLNELGLSVSKLFPRGTIFMSIAANIGDVAISTFDAACPDSVVAISPQSGINQEWLFQSLLNSKLA